MMDKKSLNKVLSSIFNCKTFADYYAASQALFLWKTNANYYWCDVRPSDRGYMEYVEHTLNCTWSQLMAEYKRDQDIKNRDLRAVRV